MKDRIQKRHAKLLNTKSNIKKVINAVKPEVNRLSQDSTLSDYESDLREVDGELKSLEWVLGMMEEAEVPA